MKSLTLFKSVFDNKTHKRVDFNDYAAFERLFFDLAALPLKDKKSATLISPAIYEPDTTRSNASVIGWAGWCAGRRMRGGVGEQVGGWWVCCGTGAGVPVPGCWCGGGRAGAGACTGAGCGAWGAGAVAVVLVWWCWCTGSARKQARISARQAGHWERAPVNATRAQIPGTFSAFSIHFLLPGPRQGFERG